MNLLVIVFILFIVISICFLTLKIEINVRDVKIKNIYMLFAILKFFEKNKKQKIFDYFNVDIYIIFYILYFIPIFFIKLDQNKIKKVYIKNKIKDLKTKDKNKIIRKNEKNDLLITNIMNIWRIYNLNINLNFSTSNSFSTAILVGIVDSAFSILLPLFLDNNYTSENCIYSVKPIYSDNLDFYFKFNSKLYIPIYKLI